MHDYVSLTFCALVTRHLTGQDILSRGSHALTDLLNTVAPPISEHEVLQVWLGHEMKGYEGVVGVVYGAVGNVSRHNGSHSKAKLTL